MYNFRYTFGHVVVYHRFSVRGVIYWSCRVACAGVSTSTRCSNAVMLSPEFEMHLSPVRCYSAVSPPSRQLLRWRRRDVTPFPWWWITWRGRCAFTSRGDFVRTNYRRACFGPWLAPLACLCPRTEQNIRRTSHCHCRCSQSVAAAWVANSDYRQNRRVGPGTVTTDSICINTCALPLTNQTLNLSRTLTVLRSSEHPTKYSHMSCVSREVHMRRCRCAVFTTFRCHCSISLKRQWVIQNWRNTSQKLISK